MKKLILFGDSNTYGYDPRGFLGGRYPEENRWPSIVRKALGGQYDVIEEGENGRTLPSIKSLLLKQLVAECNFEDYMVMMLGTNDILLVDKPDVVEPVMKLEQILSYIGENCLGKFILIAPPYISDVYPELQKYHDCSVDMNSRFMNMSNHYDIISFDASSWDIPMGNDGVHFSVEGHEKFAKEFLTRFRDL